MIESWRRMDASVIEIECSPITSLPFWKHMGFRGYNRNRAYMILTKAHELPPTALAATVRVAFYPERAEYEDGIKPLMVAMPRAARTSTSTISLSERVIYFEGAHGHANGDAVVSIEVDGLEIYRDKAKYDGADELGVERDAFGYFIDELRLVG